MVATLLLSVTAMGIATGAYALCLWRGHPKWAVAVLLALAGIAFVIYQRVLAAASDIAVRKRDVLVEELRKMP